LKARPRKMIVRALVQYLIESKTSAFEKRELHIYFDAELVRPCQP
jgi:hypothetical protein